VRESSEIAARKAPEVVFDTLPCWRSPRCCANPLRPPAHGSTGGRIGGEEPLWPGRPRKRRTNCASRATNALRFPWCRPNTWEVTLNAVGQANVTLIQSTVIRAICAALALAVALATPAVQGT
jgi:hypothetical protein